MGGGVPVGITDDDAGAGDWLSTSIGFARLVGAGVVNCLSFFAFAQSASVSCVPLMWGLFFPFFASTCMLSFAACVATNAAEFSAELDAEVDDDDDGMAADVVCASAVPSSCTCRSSAVVELDAEADDDDDEVAADVVSVFAVPSSCTC